MAYLTIFRATKRGATRGANCPGTSRSMWPHKVMNSILRMANESQCSNECLIIVKVLNDCKK